MGLSSQLAPSAIAKPGVCTSSTRPASPYEGQVIYETDTDKTLVWNGSAWVYLSTSTANPVGLEFVASTSFSATTTPFINGCFNSTYDHYRLMISATGSSAQDVRCRLRYSTSTVESGAVYDRWGFSSSASVAVSNVANQTSALLANVANDANAPMVVTIDIFNPNRLNLHTNLQIQGYGANNGSLVFWNNRVETTTEYTGFEMTADSGTLTGSIRVYGYRN